MESKRGPGGSGREGLAMTVKQLREWLRGFDDNMKVIVADEDREETAVFVAGTDEDLNPCVVIDLCQTFE